MSKYSKIKPDGLRLSSTELVSGAIYSGARQGMPQYLTCISRDMRPRLVKVPRFTNHPRFKNE